MSFQSRKIKQFNYLTLRYPVVANLASHERDLSRLRLLLLKLK